MEGDPAPFDAFEWPVGDAAGMLLFSIRRVPLDCELLLFLPLPCSNGFNSVNIHRRIGFENTIYKKFILKTDKAA